MTVAETLNTTTQHKLLMTENETAPLLGVSPRTLRISRSTGTLMGVPTPPYIKFATKVRYRLSDVQEWIDGLDTHGKEGM